MKQQSDVVAVLS